VVRKVQRKKRLDRFRNLARLNFLQDSGTAKA
jgi:hypothetical protein